MLITVYINRGAPEALRTVVGGWNETNNVVDMRWDRYDERDLQGYRVVRGSRQPEVCPAAAATSSRRTCTDSAAARAVGLHPGVAAVYEVYAMDCTDLQGLDRAARARGRRCS